MTAIQEKTSNPETPIRQFGTFVREHSDYYERPPTSYAVSQGIWRLNADFTLFGERIPVGDVRFSESAIFDDDMKNTGKSSFTIEFFHGAYERHAVPHTAITADPTAEPGETFLRDGQDSDVRVDLVVNEDLLAAIGLGLTPEQWPTPEPLEQAIDVEQPQSEFVDEEAIFGLLGDLNACIDGGMMVKIGGGNSLL
jgi:hypothetical protein